MTRNRQAHVFSGVPGNLAPCLSDGLRLSLARLASGVHDLGVPYGSSSFAYAINDQGWIVGQTRFDEGGELRATLWVPVAEPPGLVVLACALFGMPLLVTRSANTSRCSPTRLLPTRST